MKLTGVSLFAGVGGFDLAMERNGVEVVANVEIDKQCQKVLAKHFPKAKQFSDITDVKGSDLIGATTVGPVNPMGDVAGTIDLSNVPVGRKTLGGSWFNLPSVGGSDILLWYPPVGTKAGDRFFFIFWGDASTTALDGQHIILLSVFCSPIMGFFNSTSYDAVNGRTSAGATRYAVSTIMFEVKVDITVKEQASTAARLQPFVPTIASAYALCDAMVIKMNDDSS